MNSYLYEHAVLVGVYVGDGYILRVLARTNTGSTRAVLVQDVGGGGVLLVQF